MNTIGEHNHLPLRGLDEGDALRAIVEGTATETGERFFAALVQNLAQALNTEGAWVTEYFKDTQRLRALAFWLGGRWVDEYEYDITGTPCELVVRDSCLVHVPENVVDMYPGDPDLAKFQAVSYLGVPLLDIDNSILGNLAVMDTRPLPAKPRYLELFRIFAARAAAELQRLRAEIQVREREEQLCRLIDSAMDAIFQLDRHLTITRVNPAAEHVFRCPVNRLLGQGLARFLTIESQEKLLSLRSDLDLRPARRQSLWIPGGLMVMGADGERFPAEASLARFEMQRQPFYTLILRNVNDQIKAEQKIQSLTAEAEYLREEVQAMQNFGAIIGQSKPLLKVLQDVNHVAETDTTVLILGETGTGKELIARAIHTASQRREYPFITVNCAAIPATLMESEFFGHEKGAFTGATRKRQGRFTLANGGTIFLDEIGELPLELQAKLLRVLQEGEFEPVGSSHPQKVDVRVLAATNRNLEQSVQAGEFREDLYYRLNVFPITIPPLRERGDDIVLLATAFVDQFARRMGQTLEPLSPASLRRLKAYHWPGNVRELQNIIERAVITARNGHVNLDRALPETGITPRPLPQASLEEPASRIWTIQELQDLERTNLLRALEATDWKVAGEHGAARLLGIPASTLSSRMKALDIQRPR